MRGILGHLVASKIEIDESLFDETVREFIFDENTPIPEKICLFYWVYPYNRTVIMRDFAMPSVRGNFGSFGVFQTIKYFPVAYLAADLPRYESLLELTKYRECSIDEEVNIPIRLDKHEHYFWPEMVDKGNIVMAGQAASNSVSAQPKKIILKKS